MQHIQDDMQLKLNETFMKALLCTGNQDLPGLKNISLHFCCWFVKFELLFYAGCKVFCFHFS